MESNTTLQKPNRLLSLDILRGADLAMLVLVQPILLKALETMQPAEGTVGHFVMGQLLHLPWEGFCFWDIIMPLFMFMSGITIPFAMARYKRGERIDGSFYRRILKRFVVLWILGMVCQGNLLAFDLQQLHLYSNTLQSIAVGYVAVAFLYVFCSLRTQIIAVSLSFLAYIAIFAIWGNFDFTIDSNICEAIDRAVLGRFRDGVIWQGNQWHWDPTYHYTWIMSSLNFIVTVYLGTLAGYLLKSERTAMQKFYWLMAGGVAMIAVSLCMHPWIPIIKHIWSSSMTLFSGGICFILMGLFYYIIDVKGCRKGWMWLRYYGMNSLAAYYIGDHIDFNSITDSIFFGFHQWLGDYHRVLLVALQGVWVLLILKLMFKLNYFIKA